MGEFRKPWYACCAKGVNPFRTHAHAGCPLMREVLNLGGAMSVDVAHLQFCQYWGPGREGLYIGQAQSRGWMGGEGIRACNVGNKGEDKTRRTNINFQMFKLCQRIVKRNARFDPLSRL